MDVRELKIRDAFEIIPTQQLDERGVFLEWYRHDTWERLGVEALALRQANISVSRMGVLRGLHVTSVPPGQAKYVSCLYGRVRDVAVDVRVGSPTFGLWDAVTVDDERREAVYLPQGLAHGFLSLSDQAVVNYLCSTVYDPDSEITIDPFDPMLAIKWPADNSLLLSAKDRKGRSLDECLRAGVLPTYADSTPRNRVGGLASMPPVNP